MHAPLIMSGPGIPRGKKADALCYLLDIFPTLGEFTGVASPEGSEGRSLAQVIAGRAEKSPRAALLTAYTDVQRAIRDDRWKLIVYPKLNKTQLFDLSADPAEMHDLAIDPQRADDLKRMTALLNSEQEKAGDKCALTSEKPFPLDAEFSRDKAKGKAAE
jgi:arylsulfatase A-like enzyme